jgi:phosphoserine phosphatase
VALSEFADIRLVAFDLDGTLIEGTIFLWQTLHQAFATDLRARRQAAEDFRAGRIDYRQWFEEDLRLLKEAGADRRGLERVLAGLRPAQGGRQVLQELRRRGYRLAVISGSLDLALNYFYPEELFDHVLINRVFFDEKGNICGGQHTPYDLDHKAEGLRQLAGREGISTAQCAFVGDNLNDVEAMRVAGLAVAIDPKRPELKNSARLVLERGGLPRLLEILPDRTSGRLTGRPVMR